MPNDWIQGGNVDVIVGGDAGNLGLVAGRDPYGLAGTDADSYIDREAHLLTNKPDPNSIVNISPKESSFWEGVKNFFRKLWDWTRDVLWPFLKQFLSISQIPGGWEVKLGGAKFRFVKKPNQIPELTVGDSGNLFPIVMLAGAGIVLFFALS